MLSAAGNIRLNANALGQTSGAYPASGPSTGGSATITASGGGKIMSTGGVVNATANGFGLTATGGSLGSLAVDAVGGTVQVTATGAQSLISGAQGFNIQAGGTGGLDTLTGSGGSGTGGTATLTASAGGRIVGGSSISVAADGLAGNGGASGGNGGNGTAGSAQILALDGTIADGTSAGYAATALLVEAGALGGNGTFSGIGGNATGGSALQSVDRIQEFGCEVVQVVATLRIVAPKSMIRLSAGRLSMSDEAQFLCFLAGANSIFLGDKLLTSPNPSSHEDRNLLDRLGMEFVGQFEGHAEFHA